MLDIILIGVALAIIALLIVAAMQPADFRITRTTTVSAPASAVFFYVNNLQQWEKWSPWARLDPNAKNTFEEPSEGIGAKMSWVGNNKVGVGSMTITDSQPYDTILFKLEFLKPFTATNIAEFSFAAHDNQTLVTWSMQGKNNFIGKIMGLLMNCDKMVGGQFEQGLASLKAIVEVGDK
jgi:Polyketide cyclase / dehydrase and lipid transport